MWTYIEGFLLDSDLGGWFIEQLTFLDETVKL